jgi:type VI secretion system secreted protein VgrG
VPSPKSGNAGSAVSPIAPTVPHEADKADPGQMAKIKAEQQQSQSGKYGSSKEKPHKKSTEDEDKKSWIEIELVDEEGNPVPGEAYKVTLPDGSVDSGTLDEKGFCRIDGIDPGTCQITFPNLDKDAWEKA